MPSIVVTEIKASVLRHRFIDRLGDRADIVDPASLRPGLAGRLHRFLVAGLDDAREPGTGGWPVFTGGRYQKLCFSPVFDHLHDLDDGVTVRPHRLPRTEADYLGYVEDITGLGPGRFDDLARLFRFDPRELFALCADMRRDCPPAWRLLLSNAFAPALRLWSALGHAPRGTQFHHPLVDGFRVLADLERANLLMRHLARARAILDRPRLLDALRAPVPLARRYRAHQLVEVRRWIEYACFSSEALSDLMLGRDEVGTPILPPGYPPAALARGVLPDLGACFHDSAQIREAMIRVFTLPPLPKADAPTDGEASKPPVERKRGMLRNDEVLRWYGLTAEVLPVVALDDVRTRFPTRIVAGVRPPLRTTVGDPARNVLDRLASAMRRRADPAMQTKVEGTKRTANPPVNERNVKRSLKLALAYLPPAERPGGAARFDPAVWNAHDRDADLWRALLDLRTSGLPHRTDRPRRRELRQLLQPIRHRYRGVFAGAGWSSEVERTICDMAFGLSPISVDPHIAFAIHALERRPSLMRAMGRMLGREGYGRGAKR